MATKKIFTKKIAIELRGFEIIGTEPNFNKPQLDVYVFNETPEFETALVEITSSK